MGGKASLRIAYSNRNFATGQSHFKNFCTSVRRTFVEKKVTTTDHWKDQITNKQILQPQRVDGWVGKMTV